MMIDPLTDRDVELWDHLCFAPFYLLRRIVTWTVEHS